MSSSAAVVLSCDLLRCWCSCRGQKRELKTYHAPWETTPAHCLDLDSDRNAVDEMDLARFWAYLAKPANTVRFKSECPSSEGGSCVCLLCRFAGDDKRVGVATSRLAQTLSTAITRLQDAKHPIHSYLDRSKWPPPGKGRNAM